MSFHPEFIDQPENDQPQNPNLGPDAPKVRDQAPATRRDRGQGNLHPETPNHTGASGFDDEAEEE